ncbi:OmpA family protein [Myroides odoratimimus]|uniref:OmpA family protein n=1 Tax=Myroides odoratimimus TaxID=76832 RepID=UPI003D2F59AE
MKKIYKTGFIMCLSLFSLTNFAQNSYVKKANKQIQKMAYAEAITTYEKAIAKGKQADDILFNLANAYYENGMYLQANHWYKKLFENVSQASDIKDIEAYYRYIQTIRTTGDYFLANSKMELFAEKAPGDSRVKKYLSNPNYLEQVNTNRDGYRVKQLNSVNTPGSEYGSALYKGEIVYASSAKKGKQKGIHSWTNDPYTKLYSASVRIDGYIGKAKPFARKLEGNYNEANAIFSADSRTMYFSSNNRADKNVRYSDKALLVNLYRAYSFGPGKWGDVEKLSINVEHANTAFPALSPDQDWIYFSSDRPGGYGQSDLYRAKVFRDGSIGTPENLGDKINTEARESFPFVSSDNVLYFASDGHPGLGGLDLYGVQIYQDGSFGEVVNLGNSINSPYDDFAMYLDPEAKFGFITSNRPNGSGKDDLYYVRMKLGTELNISQDITGKIIDQKTKQPILDAFVFLYDSKHRMIEQIEVDKRGEYVFKDVKINRDYYVSVKATGYVSEEKSVEDVTLTDVKVVNFQLLKDTALDIDHYNNSGEAQSYKEIQKGEDLGKRLALAPIYFDHDSAIIRTDAQFELAKVVMMMKNNPTMKIQVRSHTDSKGSDAYNMGLSERRAQTTVDWLIYQGINPSRLSAKGYGETNIINHCQNNVPCLEKEHQQNRRSEFIIMEL